MKFLDAKAPIRILLLAAVVAVSVRALTAQLVECGDGREYILQTQAIVFERSLAISPAARAAYWNRTNPFGKELGDVRPLDAARPEILRESSQAYGNFGSLYPDRFGAWRYCHAWIYSLAAAPFYALLHYSGSGLEYYAFRALNAILFAAALMSIFFAWPGLRSAFLAGAVLLTPLAGYLQWAHTEVFCFALTTLSFALIESKR